MQSGKTLEMEVSAKQFHTAEILHVWAQLIKFINTRKTKQNLSDVQ